MTAVLFLDFDGVVVCLPRERGVLTNGRKVAGANTECVARLNRILQETGAKVVVSSSWRLHHSIEHLQGTLDRAGFVGEVIDVTPQLGTARGFEIWTWLKNHPEVTRFVVLDDDLDREPITLGRWVHVRDGWAMGGLQDGHADAAIRSLKTQERFEALR